ncbi:NfeD family protein [Falsihalocynthiibacter sp. SS001]|uniref:NfeD family protein n=1 Tax=Falsihalocynthiibacter sp. SS001 TaxID=3349698 RepID=UPI0036D2BA07
MSWMDWWLWMAGGIVLGILEILVPGSIFLGFAIGAISIGALQLIGVPLGGIYTVLLIWAVISAVAWIVLRRVLGVRRGQSKTFDRDIND